MQEFDEVAEETTCATCVQWQEMIESANQKLAQLRKPLGLCGIQDTVRYSFADVDDALKNPEAYEQKRVLEEELQEDVKRLTLVLLSHQRKDHSPVVA